MDRDELDSLTVYVERRLQEEDRASRKSPVATMAVVRMIALAITERTAARLSAIEDKLAGAASASRIAELTTRIETLERRLREIERA